MPDLFRLWSVLNELEHLVSHHDVARRHREIFSDFKGAEVDLRWNRPAFDGILQEVLIAIEQALAAAFDSRLDCRRVAE